MICPNCKANISDHSAVCPVCGFSTQQKWYQKNSWVTVLIMLVSLIFLGACAFFFLYSPNREADTKEEAITKLNQTYEGSILKITATHIQVSNDPWSDDLTAAVYFVVQNVSDESTFLSNAHFEASVDDVAVNGMVVSGFNQNGESLSVDMSPGKFAKGYYNVPISANAKTIEIRIEEGYTDDEAIFIFDIPWDTKTTTSTSATASVTTLEEDTAPTQKPTTTEKTTGSTQKPTTTEKTTESTQKPTTTKKTTEPTQEPTTTVAPSTTSTPPSQTTPNTVSYAKFVAIQMGMSYEAVCEFLGVEGTQSMENGDTAFYTWRGAEQISNISLAFENNRLTSKAQSGLTNPNASGVGITLAEYNQLENGMTYEQVCQIIGGEGSLSSETGEKNSAYHTVLYLWKGESSISNASLAFSNGKLTAKAQYGLD